MTRQREMIRCVVCGHPTWPSRLAEGEIGGHRLEVLELIKGLGRGRGVLWKRRNVGDDPLWIKHWIVALEKLMGLLRSRLNALLPGTEEDELAELVRPVVCERPREIARPVSIIQPRILKGAK